MTALLLFLARLLASLGGPTLAVDPELREPGVGQVMPAPPAPGGEPTPIERDLLPISNGF